MSSRRLSSRLALAGSALAAGGLLSASLLPAASVFAADPPHLVAYGPNGTVAVGSSVGISAQVAGATGVPVYQFRVNHRIVQRYSTNNHFVLKNAAAGHYTVVVRSLGMGQYRRQQWHAFRSQTLHFVVGGPPELVATGPKTGVAKHGTAFIRARVKNAVAVPYFRFAINGSLARRYSQKNYLVLRNLAPGTYVVQVKSLGPGQFRNHEWWAARVRTVRFTVPRPSVTETVSQLKMSSVGPLVANGTATETIAVTATNQAGQPVAGAPVTFISSNPDVASVSAQAVKTNADGIAQVTLTAGTTVGQSTVTAIAEGVSTTGTVTTTPEHAEPSLSSLKVSGQQAGSGTESAPAILATGTPMTVATTLTGRSGAPRGGVELTFTVMPASSGGSLSDLAATAGGKTLNGTQVSGGGVAYTVPTDSNGNAAITLTQNGSPVEAMVSVTAPYAAYQAPSAATLIWANPGTAVLTPAGANQVFGTSQNPGAGVVPVTATIVSGPGVTIQNQPVVFTLNSDSSANAFFSTSNQGTQNSGRSVTVNTDASGQAIAYVDDIPSSPAGVSPAPGTASATVTATRNGQAIDAVGTTSPAQIHIIWGTSGYPAALSMSSIPSSETTGSPLTLSGTLTDVTGKPVSGAAVRLIPVTSSGQPDYNGTDSFIANGATTAFSGQNPYASATTDSQGNFSFTVADSAPGTDLYEVEYQPSSGAPVTFGSAGLVSVKWQPSIQPAALAVAPAASSLSAKNSSEAIDTDENAPVTSYVEAFTKSDTPVTLSSSGVSSITYQFTAASGARIASVNGVQLASPTKSVAVTVNADGTLSANGQSLGTVPSGSALLSFTVDGIRSGNTSVAISADHQSATVNLQVAGTPHQVAFNPQSILPATVLNSGPVTETLTVEGANGHPVPGATVAIDGSTPNGTPGSFQSGQENDAVWVTAVNGTHLTTQENGQTRSDAFPLVDAATDLGNLGYQYPTSAAGIHFQNGVMMATANAQGQITLTLRGAGASFWSTANGEAGSSANALYQETSQALTDGTYGLGTWYQGQLIGSAMIGNATNPSKSSAPSSQTLAKGSAVPLTFTFNDGKGNPIEGARVTFSTSGLSHATFGTSSTASKDTATGASQVTGALTNSKGEVTIYVVDGTAGETGTVTAAVDGIQLTSGQLTVGS